MTATSELEAARSNLRGQMEAWTAARKHFLGESSYPYCSNEDLVLRHGRVFTRAPQIFATIPRACFARAYEIAMRKENRDERNPKRWIYCEGYGLAPKCPMAVNHAWLTRADTPELAYELAWDAEVVGARNTAYYGMAFDAAYVRKVHLASKKKFYSVLDHWWGKESYPLLTGGVKIEDVMWKGTK